MRKIVRKIRSIYQYYKLTPQAKLEHRLDKQGLPESDPGIETTVNASIDWFATAQDKSLSQDNGVARYYSLLSGWSSSYPETTGYIFPTILNFAEEAKDQELLQRARRMLDWLVSIQLPDGGFQGGLIDSKPVVPVTFNTGSVLIGLAAGAAKFGKAYHQAMVKAADWLVKTQDDDGYWRSHPSPFAAVGEKSYYAIIAWGLFETARIEPRRGYDEAAIAVLNWSLKFQRGNGWFDNCCLSDPVNPLTHTIGHVFRSMIEAYQYTNDSRYLDKAILTADGIVAAVQSDNGFLPGRLDSDWNGTVPWACLPGSVQISYCLLQLSLFTNNLTYRQTGFKINEFVRRTIKVYGAPDTRGAIKGSFPVYGNYGPYRFINGKFLIDACLLEQKIKNS